MTIRRERASLSLRSGRRFDVLIEMEMPQGYNRTSDFINGEDEFFALGCGDRVWLVNKRRVRDVRLDGASGLAAA